MTNWGKTPVEVFELKRLLLRGFLVVYAGSVILWVKKLEYTLCYRAARETQTAKLSMDSRVVYVALPAF